MSGNGTTDLQAVLQPLQPVEANEARRKRMNQRAVFLSAITILVIVGIVVVVSVTAGLGAGITEVKSRVSCN